MFSVPTDKIEIATRLLAPDLLEGHVLYPVLASALKSRLSPEGRPFPERLRFVPLSDSGHPNIMSDSGHLNIVADRPFWHASYFNLDHVTVYRNSDEVDKHAILLGCSRSVLAEAYYIEKCGMYFASKTLSYIVQVILEGWGISHYHALAKNCLDDGLATVLENVIRDEGRHHAGGLALFNERPHGADSLKRLTDLLEQLLLMVQAGPQMVVSQIEKVKGRLSQSQKTRAFAELNCEAVTLNRIKTLKSLIKTAAGSDVILSELERKGSFRPYTASECAAASG